MSFTTKTLRPYSNYYGLSGVKLPRGIIPCAVTMRSDDFESKIGGIRVDARLHTTPNLNPSLQSKMAD